VNGTFGNEWDAIMLILTLVVEEISAHSGHSFFRISKAWLGALFFTVTKTYFVVIACVVDVF